MGYFSNGTQGMDYEARYCAKCHHHQPNDGGCMVWLAHMLHNYRDCNDDESILHLLIPRSEDNLGNEQCSMFVPKQDVLHGALSSTGEDGDDAK